MSKQALYREYRPKNFKEVRGQAHVVDLLSASVKNKKVSHAYMFSGSRGTGKTSVARIFAKEIGCADIDVFEIDAASHTSVEHIRELNESVVTLPVSSPYKVYILDEAHMLSKSAFNAFLKTLEEPPTHAIFILATTEKDKIPDTVISRCLPVLFKNPTVSDIEKLLMSVSKAEGYTLDPQACVLISLVAEGSYRDALSALQKVLIVSSGKKVELSQVEKVLGAPDHLVVNSYIEALLSGDVPAGVSTLESLVGSDMVLFGKLVVRKIRAALLLKEKVADAVKGYSKEDVDFVKKISSSDSLSISLLKKVVNASDAVASSYIKQLPFEEALLV